MTRDLEIGALVMLAQRTWQRAPWYRRAAAWTFGQHHVFEHLDLRFRIGFWRDMPYLLSIREV